MYARQTPRRTGAPSRRQRGSAESCGLTIGSIVGFVLFGVVAAAGYQFYRHRVWAIDTAMRWHQGIHACEQERWQPVGSREWNFEATMPCATGVERIAVQGEAVPGWNYLAEGEHGDLFEVSYLDLSALAATPGFDANPEVLLWEIRKYVTEQAGATLESKKVLSLGGYPGREYWLRDALGHRVFYRSYYAEDTVYIVAVTSRGAERPSARHRRFLDSFAFLEGRGSAPAGTPTALTLGGRKAVRSPRSRVRPVARSSPGGRRPAADPRQQRREVESDREQQMKRSADVFLKRQKSIDWYNRL